MYSQPLKTVMEKDRLIMASPRTTVSEAARRMAQAGVGAVMVIERNRLIGIFTERDAVFRVIARGRDSKSTRLAEVMTRDPKTLDPEASFGYALHVMYEHGFRHIPVLQDRKLVGVVSARNALDPDLEEF